MFMTTKKICAGVPLEMYILIFILGIKIKRILLKIVSLKVKKSLLEDFRTNAHCHRRTGVTRTLG